MNPKLNDLPSRALFHSISASIVIALILLLHFKFFHPIFTATVAAFSSIVLWEYYALARKKEINPAVLIGIIAGIIYIFTVFFLAVYPNFLWKNLPEIVLGLFFLASFIYYAFNSHNALASIAVTFFGVIYIAIPLSTVVDIAFLNDRWNPIFWLFYLVAVTKSSDMGGYFFGKSFGKKKLAKTLSPNKTWAGAIGGLVTAILVSVIFKFFNDDISIYIFIGLGALIGILSQMGDLAESLLKRDARAKDSNKIRGVGGFLDMVDSLLFTAPVLYLFLKVYYL